MVYVTWVQDSKTGLVTDVLDVSGTHVKSSEIVCALGKVTQKSSKTDSSNFSIDVMLWFNFDPDRNRDYQGILNETRHISSADHPSEPPSPLRETRLVLSNIMELMDIDLSKKI